MKLETKRSEKKELVLFVITIHAYFVLIEDLPAILSRINLCATYTCTAIFYLMCTPVYVECSFTCSQHWFISASLLLNRDTNLTT